MKTENESRFFVPPHETEHSEGITGMSEIYVSQSGFCRISIARHLGRKVIVKSLKPDCVSSPLARQQLDKEFALAFPVDSPYVSRMLASVTLPDGTPAIEMEFCQGDTLRSLFDRACSLTPDEASGMVTSLLLGLEDIHRAGVIHRDIKPSNIIFDGTAMSLKIIDFGCAHSFDYIPLRGPAGTIPYTPPEKRNHSAEPHPSDDLYAAGMVIMELAANCADRRMSRRLESFGKALSARRFSSAREALDFFSRGKTAKSPSRLLIAVAVILVVAAAAFFLLPPPTGTDDISPSGTSAGDNVGETVVRRDTTHAAAPLSPIENYTDPASGPSAPADEAIARRDDPIPADDHKDITATESDQELRRMAVQAGPMALIAKEKYTSDRLRGNAFALTSADSIYMHHLYKEFPTGSQTDESLSKAVDSIYIAENPALEPEYRRRAGKTFDRHRFKILFKSRLEYMLKYHGATTS